MIRTRLIHGADPASGTAHAGQKTASRSGSAAPACAGPRARARRRNPGRRDASRYRQRASALSAGATMPSSRSWFGGRRRTRPPVRPIRPTRHRRSSPVFPDPACRPRLSLFIFCSLARWWSRSRPILRCGMGWISVLPEPTGRNARRLIPFQWTTSV